MNTRASLAAASIIPALLFLSAGALAAEAPVPAAPAPEGKVVTYPAPPGETLSTEYEVLAAGQKVDVHLARTLDPPFAGKEWDYGGNYSFAGFDMAGTVEVRIASKRPLREAAIRPAGGVRSSLADDRTMILTLDRPRKLSIEPDGRKGPLLLFADPLETEVPKPGDPGVAFFGPGIHEPGKIVVGPKGTLYLAGGAVVKAEVLAEGDGIRIRGRGILDGSTWEWRKGPVGNLIAIRNSSDVEVSGITLRGSSHWTIVPSRCRNVRIRGVKICNSRVQNDDGINPCNSQDVRISDCFIRSDDDCVALKGLDLGGPNPNVEGIVVEDSVLWCDRARIFLLGHESRAPFMRDITLRNLDIIHFTMTPFLFEPGEDMRLENVVVEDVRIHGEGQRELARLRPVVNQYMRKKTPGFIRDVRWKGVTLEGKPGEYLVQLEGADAEHDVRGVTFEDVAILGTKLAAGSERLRIGKNVEDVRFPAAPMVLFDFERDEDVAAWRSIGPPAVVLERSPRFATSGRSALRFSSPAWKAGLPEWPSFEAKPPVTDWRPFDRLVIDITNPALERHFLALFVSDALVPFREGLFHRFDVPAIGWRRVVIPLSDLAEKKVDPGRISVLHLFGERPRTDLSLWIDGIVLLRPGESLPHPTPAFREALASLLRERAKDLETDLGAVLDAAGSGAARKIAEGMVASIRGQIEKVLEDLRSPSSTLSGLADLGGSLDALRARADRLAEVLSFARACEEAGALWGDGVLVGTASSMKKVLPRHGPIGLRPAKAGKVTLARNEKECFQLGVLPLSRDLKGVTLTAGDLRSEGGAVLPAASVRCDGVGYVETKHVPPYGSEHVGWWPDPILDFLGPIGIAAGDVQCFWVRVRAPKDQAPGLYQGKLMLRAEGMEPAEIELAVQVRRFAVPDRQPLPLAVTFGLPLEEEYSKMLRKVAARPEWSTDLKFAWADFLADHYLSWDHLYRPGPPDFEVLEHLHRQGRLGAFNLGNFSVPRGTLPGESTGDGTRGRASAPALEAMLRWAREAYGKAKDLGILDHAYIYGFDEAAAEWFPAIEETAAAVKRELPEALVLTTAYDGSYGLKTVMKSIDAWTPLTAAYNPQNAAEARKAGRQVWWYICCGPHHPHANMFIEYPAIEARLLMGAMAAKYRPDGFLYYQISIWRPESPIESGPFTSWDPVSWTTYHGDGSWTCMGPGGRPVPTIRLENFRDGLEDLAYVQALEEAVRRQEARGDSLPPLERVWFVEAKKALEVPEALVKSLTEYSRDPERLREWRDRIADLIERSGLEDLDPWKEFKLRR